MAKLIGRKVGEQIVEFLGPINERNYNTNEGVAVPPSITVQVFGAGSVQLQQTQTPIIKGNAGLNAFTFDRIADPTTWANLGAPVTDAGGPVTVVPTVDNVFCAIRAIVVTVGNGKSLIQAEWH